MSRLIARAFLCLLTLPLVTCDKMPLTAPTESIIVLSANTDRLAPGETAEIFASVIEQAGTPPQNGTVVTFIGTLGTFDPPEARTNAGKVTVRFIAGSKSGTATISAVSGGARPEEDLTIEIGAAAGAAVLVRAEPSFVPTSGGTVAIIATVVDEFGNRLSGIPVVFSTDAGQISRGSAITDANGEARTSLTTDRDTTVTASGGGQNGTVMVTAIQQSALGVTLSAEPNPVLIDGDTLGIVSFTATVTGVEADPGDSIEQYVWDFGDGPQFGQVTTGNTTNHFYGIPGQYVARVRVVTARGREGFAEHTVRVLQP